MSGDAGQPAAPSALHEAAVQVAPVAFEPLSPHRECMGCGFDLVGLARSAKCPECERPVARTLDVPLLRERAGAARRALAGLWTVTGTCIAAPGMVLLFAVLSNFFGISGFVEWFMEHVWVWVVLAGLLVGSWLVALAMPRMSPARRWCLAGAWGWVGVIGLAVATFVLQYAWQRSWQTTGARPDARWLLTASMWCIGGVLTLLGVLALMLPMACGALARHVDKFHLRTQTRRYRVLSLALLIPGALAALVSLGVRLLELDELIPGAAWRYLEFALFFYFVFLLGWYFYTLLVLGRLIAGVRVEIRALRTAGARP